MAKIIPQHQRGTWNGVPVATWCSGWIRRIGGGLVPHLVNIPAAVSFLPLRGAAVGRALTIPPHDWFCTWCSILFQSLEFLAMDYLLRLSHFRGYFNQSYRAHCVVLVSLSWFNRAVCTPWYVQCVHDHDAVTPSNRTYYGVATISRLLKTIGLFCKRAL